MSVWKQLSRHVTQLTRQLPQKHKRFKHFFKVKTLQEIIQPAQKLLQRNMKLDIYVPVKDEGIRIRKIDRNSEEKLNYFYKEGKWNDEGSIKSCLQMLN